MPTFMLLVALSTQIASPVQTRPQGIAPASEPAARVPSLWEAAFFPWDALNGTCSYGRRIAAEEDPATYFGLVVKSRKGDPRAIRDSTYRRALDLDCFLTWRPPAPKSHDEPLLSIYLRAGLALIDSGDTKGSMALAKSIAATIIPRAYRERFSDPFFFVGSMVFAHNEYRCAAELYGAAAVFGSVAAVKRAYAARARSDSGMSGRTCEELGIVTVGDQE